MSQDSPEGPPCPVDPETDDRFSDVLARAALAAGQDESGLPPRYWRVRIRPTSAPFCQWLLWNTAVFHDAVFGEEAEAVYWPMTTPDAHPVAHELMIQLPDLTAWAELDEH